MRAGFAIVLVGWIGFGAAAYGGRAIQPGSAGGTIAYTGGRIIDGSGAPPIENGVLVVHGSRMVAVGPAKTAIPTGARVVSMSGKTIIRWTTSAIRVRLNRSGFAVSK